MTDPTMEELKKMPEHERKEHIERICHRYYRELDEYNRKQQDIQNGLPSVKM
jgi:hypothetical protein